MEPSQKKHDTKLGTRVPVGIEGFGWCRSSNGDKGSFLQNTLKSSNCEFAAQRSYGILI
jgi:hypothetical protein